MKERVTRSRYVLGGGVVVWFLSVVAGGGFGNEGLKAPSPNALESAWGGSCEMCMMDYQFCTGTECLPGEWGFSQATGLGAAKARCRANITPYTGNDGCSAGSAVDCKEVIQCVDPGCTDCFGPVQVGITVPGSCLFSGDACTD